MHQSNKNKQQFKTITTMTKEELSAKIAQGEYTDCQRDSKFSISFKIGDTKASVTKVGNSIVAMTVISVDISEEDYNEILKQALLGELNNLYEQESIVMDRIRDICPEIDKITFPPISKKIIEALQHNP